MKGNFPVKSEEFSFALMTLKVATCSCCSWPKSDSSCMSSDVGFCCF